MSAAAAAKLAAEYAEVKELYATSLIGFAVATTIYGISVLQVYLYYRCYPDDRFLLKFTVALLFAVDTCGSMFVGHSLYTYHVFNFFTPLESLEIPWSFAAEKFLVTFTTFVAQCFYAHTIYKATVNRLTVWLIMFMALTSLALGTVTTEMIFNSPLSVVSSRKFAIISGLVQGFAALNDVVITGSLCYYLQRNRTGLPSTNHLLDTLIVYAVSRGVLTAIAQILFLITNVGLPGRTIWMPFHQVVGKLYVNSVLATLNVRSTFSQKSEIQLGTEPFKINTVPEPSTESKIENGQHQSIVFANTMASTGTNTSGFHTSDMDASDKEGRSFRGD